MQATTTRVRAPVISFPNTMKPLTIPLGKNFSPRASSTQMTTRGIMLRRSIPRVSITT